MGWGGVTVLCSDPVRSSAQLPVMRSHQIKTNHDQNEPKTLVSRVGLLSTRLHGGRRVIGPYPRKKMTTQICSSLHNILLFE